MPSDIRKILRETTQVIEYGLPVHTLMSDWGKDMEAHLSEWIITHPDEYQDCVRQCIAAGVDIVSTGTQASSPWRAETFGIGRDKVWELNYKSAKLAREATPPDRWVGGMTSCTNPDFLEPIGAMTYQKVYDGYKLQIEALLEGGADLIWMGGNHLEEAAIAVKVAKDLADVPVMVSNVYYAGKKGFHTMVGADPRTASARCQEAGADVIGFNCGLMSKESRDPKQWYDGATELLRQVRQGTDRPMCALPDPCLPELIDGQTVWAASPEDMARVIPDWVREGARVVGGCCGTTLEHYRKVSEALRQLGVKVQ